MIDSLLFRSPYSGAQNFSGWPKEPCAGPIPWTPAKNACKPSGAVLCTDKYGKTFQPLKTPPAPKCGLPRATVTLSTPAYRLRPIAGPSATGPWTYRDTQGAYPVFRAGGVGTGQSLGLT
jgi:hypothetical protein